MNQQDREFLITTIVAGAIFLVLFFLLGGLVFNLL
jgi:hypothetical protein